MNNRARRHTHVAIAVVFCCGVLTLAGCKTKMAGGAMDPSRPYIGTWRMPSSGATWAFNADGTCTVNGKPGTYTEAGGVIQLAGAASYSVQWQASPDGRRLTLTRPKPDGSQGYAAEFERQ